MSNDRTPFGGDDFTDIEERLRVALAQEVRDMEPDDRLDEIRAEVGAGAHGAGRPRWLAPVGAAAAVAAVAVVAWVGLRPGTTPPVPVAPNPASSTASAPSVPTSSAPPPSATSASATSAAPSSATSAPSPSATSAPPSSATSAPPPSAPPAPSPSATSPAPPATKPFAVPGYFVTPYGTNNLGLVREYIGTQLPANADAAAQGAAALSVSLNAAPYAKSDGYLQPWPSGTTAKVTLASNEIQVVLSGPGVTGLAAEQQRIAVQQVVWAVTAGVQQNVPVRISVAAGGNIFETMPASVYKRPADAQAYQDLAPIWVDTPSRDQVLPSGAPVVVKGQACTFEANVQWELKRGNAVVRQDHTTASSGCPQQGSWSVDLGTLTVGTYTFRAFELSAADGSLRAQKVVSFSVK